jgi:hypothetical protein
MIKDKSQQKKSQEQWTVIAGGEGLWQIAATPTNRDDLFWKNLDNF